MYEHACMHACMHACVRMCVRIECIHAYIQTYAPPILCLNRAGNDSKINGTHNILWKIWDHTLGLRTSVYAGPCT